MPIRVVQGTNGKAYIDETDYGNVAEARKEKTTLLREQNYILDKICRNLYAIRMMIKEQNETKENT